MAAVFNRSTDGGDTWQQTLQSLSSTGIMALAISPNFDIDNTIFAGTNNGVYRSITSGGSWQTITEGQGLVRALGVSPKNIIAEIEKLKPKLSND